MSSASVKTHANITQSEGEGARCQKTNAATIQPMQTITSGTSVTSCRRTKSIMSIILHAIRRHYQLLLYITPVQISVSAHPALTIDTVSMYGPSAAQVGSNSILIIQGPEPALAGGLPGLGIHRSGKAAEGAALHDAGATPEAQDVREAPGSAPVPGAFQDQFVFPAPDGDQPPRACKPKGPRTAWIAQREDGTSATARPCLDRAIGRRGFDRCLRCARIWASVTVGRRKPQEFSICDLRFLSKEQNQVL
jgi:hypothetical protein